MKKHSLAEVVIRKVVRKYFSLKKPASNDICCTEKEQYASAGAIYKSKQTGDRSLPKQNLEPNF